MFSYLSSEHLSLTSNGFIYVPCMTSIVHRSKHLRAFTAKSTKIRHLFQVANLLCIANVYFALENFKSKSINAECLFLNSTIPGRFRKIIHLAQKSNPFLAKITAYTSRGHYICSSSGLFGLPTVKVHFSKLLFSELCSAIV